MATKFSKNMFCYCAKNKYILKLSHALYRPHKLIKVTSTSVILLQEHPYLLCTLKITLQSISEKENEHRNYIKDNFN